MEKIKIDIVSDVACPWCYVGKKHLEKALENQNPNEYEIEWHPFQLDPSIPKEGMDRETYFSNKFGSMEKFDLISEHLINTGSKAGIDFDFKKMPKVVNTLVLHQLLEIAGREGFKAKLKEKMLRANFELGQDLSDLKVLTELCSEFGWTQEKIQAIISDDVLATVVKNEIKHFQNLGVSGVPFFIFNNTYGVSGAQPAEVFQNMLEKLKSEISVQNIEGETCDIDGKNC